MVLLRSGDLPAARRQLVRGIAELRGSKTMDQLWAARLTSTLCLIHRREGALSIAIDGFERAADLARSATGGRDTAAMCRLNLSLTRIHRGDFEAATAILEELSTQPQLPTDLRALVRLARVLLFLHAGMLDECERELAAAGEFTSDLNLRTRMILREYAADVAIARGRASEVVAELEALLQEARDRVAEGDLVPEIARRLAFALLATGDASRGLEVARLAARTGRFADALEWIAGLRVASACLAALGRKQEARATLVEAYAAVETTEFMAERARLDLVARELGFEALAPTRGHSTKPALGKRSASAAQRIVLRDGRFLLTHDRDLVETIRIAAGDGLPVLIEGETGTGKELVARLIHELSDRREKTLVVVDCTNLTESLAGAELFGSRKGAYSGADEDRAGFFGEANRSTLFLDELGELPRAVQGKLLRVSSDGTYHRLGDSLERRTDVRLIAATNRSLDDMVKAGDFKSDVYHRLGAHRIHIAPLRLRPDDLRILAGEFAVRAGLSEIADDAMAAIFDHAWPGNVRELGHVIQVSARRLPRGAVLDAESLNRWIHWVRSGPATFQLSGRDQTLRESIVSALGLHGGTIARAAEHLHMSRQGLDKAMRRLGLK